MGHEKVDRLPFCKCPCDILSGVSIYSIFPRVFEQLVNSRAVAMGRYARCNMVILMAATTWLMSFSPCIVCGFDSDTVLFKCPQRKSTPSPWGGGFAVAIPPECLFIGMTMPPEFLTCSQNRSVYQEVAL